jgi:hypothetical protein
VSDWIDDSSYSYAAVDHHSVNFLTGDVVRVHHFAFELNGSAYENACDLLARRGSSCLGPVAFGPGHNVAVFHGNRTISSWSSIELDQMKDEELGYFEPRPWHRDKPQRPKVWRGNDSMIWGPPPPPGFM